jgi:hypothetical protein
MQWAQKYKQGFSFLGYYNGNIKSGKKFMNKKIFTGLIIFACSSLLAIASTKSGSSVPSLQIPIQCNLNRNCWISEYPDLDPTTNWHDYTGGERTVDGHKGTDIIIKDVDEMKKGVPVIAAASGIVTAVRDGVTDINVKKIGANTVDKMGCGNTAIINIGNGWITMYCHMRKDSVAVKTGDTVSVGQKIGYVGMSGLAETPHLHFQLMRSGDFIDPFSGKNLNGDKIVSHTLWQKNALRQLKYSPAFIYNIGVSGKEPDALELQSGNIDNTGSIKKYKDIYLWADLFGLDKNDTISFTIKDSENYNIVDEQYTLERKNVRRFFTLKHSTQDMEPGLYQAIVALNKPQKKFKYIKKIMFKID